MMLFRFSAVLLTLFTSVALAHAGMGYNFGAAGNSGEGRPFNFAVSSTSPAPMGMMTAEEFSGEELGPGEDGPFGWYRRLEARYSPQSTFGSFGDSGYRFRGRGFQGGAGSGIGGGGGSSFGSSRAGGGGGGGAGSSMADEQTSGSNPYNAGYCYCPGRPTVDGDDDDDDDTGGPVGGGGGDDDDDDDDTGGPGGPGGPGGGPDPSVVPEPGSLSLWALAGALLIGVTRRKGSEE